MKFQKILFTAIALIAVVGCETDNGDDGVKQSGYTISVDKDVIEADGVDSVAFTVTDKDGNDLTADPELYDKVYFVNEETESRLERKTRTFTSIHNGVYTFYATFRGVRTDNSVTVTVQNRSLYEKYKHKVCIYQCTGTWCGYCPQMTSALDKVRVGKHKDNVIILAVHAGEGDNYALPWGTYDLGTTVCANNGGSGFPYAVYDLAEGSGQRTESYINSFLDALMFEYPATCGVKISKAQIGADGKGVIEASIKADKAGTFDIAWAVLADNQPSNGGVEPIYHDVVQAVSTNFMKLSKESKVTLAAGEEYTKSFEVTVPTFNGVAFDPANCKVVVKVHNEQMVDNANICAVGSSANYATN